MNSTQENKKDKMQALEKIWNYQIIPPIPWYDCAIGIAVALIIAGGVLTWLDRKKG